MSQLARVVSREQLATDIVSYWLEAPGIAREIQPGQFVQVRARSEFEPFLRRPLSVAQQKRDRIRLVFRVTGIGTRLLAGTARGDQWDLLGPLGKPAPAKAGRRLVLVGGGIGIPPLLFLAERVARSSRTTVLLGARSAAGLILESEFRRLPLSALRLATDDGSRKPKGLVTDLLEKELQMQGSRGQGKTLEPLTPRPLEPCLVVFACGPRPMLKRVKELTSGIDAFAFWEERMGCGSGICYCCAVKSAGRDSYIRFCREGPVLNLKGVEF